MLLLLLTIAANTHAKIGDIISPEVLRVGINGEMPSDCTEWLYYTWEGILRCEVTSESPKECQLMGDFLADTGEYVQAISDPNGRLAANEACHIIVPQYVKGYRVVGVGHFSLYKNDFVTSIHFPEGVRSVVNAAIYENKKLTYVSLPSTIETLGATAFTGNEKLKEVYIHSITPPTVGDRTFDGNDATLHVLYASSYKKEPWTNWFGTDGIVYPDLTIGDVMVDSYEQHMELEQRLAVAYPQMKEAFNNGTAYAWFNGKKNELTLRNMTLNCGAIGEEVRPISTAHDINVNLEGDNHFTGRVTTGMYFGGLTTLNITGTTQIDMEGDCYSLDGIVSNGDGLYLKGGG